MLLIDTHVLLWVLTGDERVHANARDLIQDELRRQRLFVSSPSTRRAATRSPSSPSPANCWGSTPGTP